LRDLYKKHHGQAAGPTFYQLHLLFDSHYDEQSESVDAIAERIQLLGGVSIAMDLKMPKKAQVLALLELPPHRSRDGMRRETVSGYDEVRQGNAAKTFAGSGRTPTSTVD
jgi:DNA-binding ferritin-like protein